MPNLDGTGPKGLGSGTGKRQGRCNTNFKNVSDEAAGFEMRPMRRNARPGRGRRCRHVQEN